VSHTDLLPHTDVVVTTGGAGTVMASLAAGVPLVLVPTEWDKPETAPRVVEAGVGLRLAPGACTPENRRGAPRRRAARRARREGFGRRGVLAC
jgi:UDP:flavonoid glycosyltransferase YjiC (YdhE family)